MIDMPSRPKGEANRELAERIATAIDASPYAAKKIADECGVTPQAVNGWKNTGRISKDMLVKLAGVLGLPLGYFIPNADAAAGEMALPPIGPLNGDKLMRLFILFSQSTEAGQDLIINTAEFAAKKDRRP